MIYWVKQLSLNMHKFFCPLVFILTFIDAKENYQPQSSQLGEITADTLSSDKDKIYAKGHVVLVSGEYYISANDVVYDKKTKRAEIKGEVRVYKGSDLSLSAKSIKADFSQDSFSLSSIYLQNIPSGLWVSAKEAGSENNVYHFKENIVSGCDIQNPIWHFDSSSGSLDQSDNILTLWNTRIYLGEIPIFYVPYMSVSINNQRKSGLLYPKLAYLNEDGFYYQQPIFIAPYNSWDITLSPQIRTSRGAGISGEFRFATPRDNLLTFQTKYFYNTKKYVQRYSILNQHIYGFNFDFETRLGTGWFDGYETLHDGFYSNFTYMNDLDYLRIDDTGKKISDRLNVSRFNYFFYSQEHYVGFYNKFFIDIAQPVNKDTFQLLPGLQYHKFYNSLFWKNLNYSIDVQTNNITRQEGYGYYENTINIPIGIELPLFDGYLSIGASTDLNFTNINLYHTKNLEIANHPTINYKNANFFTANYLASLATDLAKDYGTFMHTFQLMAKISGPYYRYTSDMFSDNIYKDYSNIIVAVANNSSLNSEQKKVIINNLWNPGSIVDFDTNKHRFEIQLSQYFYNNEGNTLFYYNLSQKLNLQSQDYLFSENMINEIGSSPINGLDLKTSVYYSFFYKDITEVSANIDFQKWHFKGSLGYYYKKLFASKDSSVNANFINFSLSNDFGYFGLSGEVNYDFLAQQIKDWSVKISTDIRCFGVTLKFAQETASILTDKPNQPLESIVNNYVRLEFRFTPLSEVGVAYRFNK
ncbi:LPS-assembly protein LptD [Helicobacter cholecystus]|uniref:LPS-assembly protein LptD n=1 Tax=Helicobacter cholecystus TaxID=45498 RepID=A0A3D8IWB9_9HELI|nr:LPS-assembly protein LptD [Helicobacter cholecystus]